MFHCAIIDIPSFFKLLASPLHTSDISAITTFHDPRIVCRGNINFMFTLKLSKNAKFLLESKGHLVPSMSFHTSVNNLYM